MEAVQVGPEGIVAESQGYGPRVIMALPSVPADNGVGFSHGCIVINLGGTTANDACYVNVGNKAACNFDSITSLSPLSSSPLVLNGITYTSFQVNSIEALRLDDAAISGLAAAAATAGASVYLATQNGGAATINGLAAGSITVTSGTGSNGAVGGIGGGGDGGTITLTAGTGGDAAASGGGNGGNAGNIVLTAGSVGAGDGAGASGLGSFIKLGSLEYHAQANPGTLNSTGTLTAALLTGGIVTSTTAAGVTATLDTGTAMDAALGTAMGTGVGFYWSVINTGGNTLTVTAAASGHTVVGTMTVATLTSARFFTRRTTTTTWITYRVGG